LVFMKKSPVVLFCVVLWLYKFLLSLVLVGVSENGNNWFWSYITGLITAKNRCCLKQPFNTPQWTSTHQHTMKDEW
jgi:hypothetical protein